MRFRLRTLGLNANKRWYLNDYFTQSPCPLCGDVLEYEIHFIFMCKAYDEIRKTSKMSAQQKILTLLHTRDEKLLKALARYIALAWNFRN